MKKEILIIEHMFPKYESDAGSLRIHNIILMLRELGWKVSLYIDSTKDIDEKHLKFYELNQVEICRDLDFGIFYKERKDRYSIVWLSRPMPSYNKLNIIKKYSSEVKTVYDTVDLHFVREERRGEIENDEECLFNAEVYKIKELFLIKNVDCTIVVSDSDQKVLLDINPEFKIRKIPSSYVIQKETKSFRDKENLIFIGNFAHLPNIDGVIWFVNNVWPKIKIRIPSIELNIIGDGVTTEIKKLDEVDGINVIGWVEKLEPWLEKSRVSIAPLRYGAGMKGKIAEALSNGIPVVTTTVGAEGMGLINNTNAFISDDSEIFAEYVISVYTKPNLWNNLVFEGKKHADREYSMNSVKGNLLEVIDELFSCKVNFESIENLISEQEKYHYRHLEAIVKYRPRILKNKVLLWGTGSGTKLVLEKLNMHNIEVFGYIDSNPKKWGTVFNNKKVFSLEELKEQKGEFFVIISSSFVKDIEQSIIELGIEKENYIKSQLLIN